MILRNFYTGFGFFFLVIIGSQSQNLQSGVDLVTNLSNSIIPVLLKGLQSDNDNIVVGPFGILSNLAILLEASNGKTRQEILKSLKISQDHLQDLRTGFKAYCELFLDHEYEQEAAGSFNSGAVKSSASMDPKFKSLISKNYCANITKSEEMGENTLELRSDAGVMSHWRDYEKLAVYTFLSHQSSMPFLKKDKAVVAAPMIPQVGVFRSARWEDSQVILLPLQAKFVHLLLVVPDNETQLETLVGKIVNYNLERLIESLPDDEVEVYIPQLIAVNRNHNLTDLMVKSGIRSLFDPKRANLTKAFNETDHVYVKDISQSSYFSTSFVALNSVSGASSSFGSGRRKRDAKRFYLDKPFLFFLCHRHTQLVLLAGKIGNPTQIPS